MKKHTNYLMAFILLIVVGILGGLSASTGYAQDETVRYRMPQGTYIKLPQELVDSMGNESLENLLAYTNEMNRGYLQQLVTSNEMVVQSNNEIIQQQERIIQLLEALLAKPTSTSEVKEETEQ